MAEGDGHRTYRSDDVALDLALVEDDDGGWPPGSFGDDLATLRGKVARVIGRAALVTDKAAALGDPAKDAADVIQLTEASAGLRRGGPPGRG